MILFGATLNGIIVAHGGPNIPWWLLMLIGLVLIWGVAVIGIRLSVRSDLALLTFEFAVLFALAAHDPRQGCARRQLASARVQPCRRPELASAASWSAPSSRVLAFTGFEAPAYLGEEARRRGGPCQGRSC